MDFYNYSISETKKLNDCNILSLMGLAEITLDGMGKKKTLGTQWLPGTGHLPSG